MALLGHPFQPLATCYEADVASFQCLFFFPESLVRQVFLVSFVKDRAVFALAGIFLAFTCIVAYASEGPHVVHGPHNGFSGVNDEANILQREHALINPMQMDDVCLGKFGQCRYVGSCVGYIYIEKMVLLEVVGLPDDDAFPDELPYFPP